MGYEITFDNSSLNNYLVIKPCKDSNIIDYYATMAENNNIQGILPLHRQNIEGDIQLYYNITGKKRLSDTLVRQVLTNKECIKIIVDIIYIFENLEKYFLNVNMCNLSLDNVYVNNKLNIYFIMIPIDNEIIKNINDALCNFFKEIIGQNMLRYPNSNMQSYANYFFSPDFDFIEFKDLFREYTVNKTVKDTEEPKVKNPVKLSEETVKEVKPEIKQEQPKKTEPNIAESKINLPEPNSNSNLGFAIPGGGSIMDSKPKNNKKEKQAKKSKVQEVKVKKEKESLISKLLHLKKEENKSNIPNVNIPSSSQQIQNSRVEIGNVNKQQVVNSSNINNNESWKGTEFNGDNGTVMYGQEKTSNAIFLIHNGKPVKINKESFIIGRKDADYVINSPIISGLHVSIKSEQGKFYVVDENSKNGTLINNMRINPYSLTEINNGDIIQIGKEDLLVKIGN
jgi:hypothetical protein